jgi:hypothetical protein
VPTVLTAQGKKSSSCKLLCGGNRVGDKGFYFEPTIFEVYDNKATIAQEEIFGPVQCVFKWTDLNEVRPGCCAALGPSCHAQPSWAFRDGAKAVQGTPNKLDAWCEGNAVCMDSLTRC